MLLAAAATTAQAQIAVRDDADRQLLARSPAQRIIALTDFLADLVASAGAGSRLVAVGGSADIDAKLMGTTTIAIGEKLSVQRVLALKPDLVLATLDTLRPDYVDRLTAAGVNVFIARNEQLEDPPRLLRAVGALVGGDVGAMADAYDAKIKALRRANLTKRGLKVFVELWNRPLLAASGNHFLSEALEVCQARNILGDWKAPTNVITYDHVRVRDPDVILGVSSASNGEEFRANWSMRQSIGAVRERRLLFVYVVSPRSPGLGTAGDVEQICEGLDVIRDSMARH